MLTVSLPTPDALEIVGELPDVRLLVWDGTGDPPAEIELFVAKYNAPPPQRSALERITALRVIQSLAAGIEPWRGVVPDGVVLCNGRGIHGASTAELAFAGMLSVLREMPRWLDDQRAGRWDPAFTAGLTGRDVLVVGAGDIAQHVAGLARVLDCEVTLVARTARDGVHALDELPALLPRHEIVVLAVPLTPQTQHLVDAAFLAALPDGALLVNVARGGVVDTDALLAELTARRLYAFLDVTDPEPLPSAHPLWSAPNVLITPHVGGGTNGWPKRAYRLVREQAQALRDGRPLANQVRDGY